MLDPTHPHVEELLTFLRFPSISTDPAYTASLQACAEWIQEKLKSLGLTTTLHSTPGHPILVATTKRDPAKRTVLIYGHYDVQPVDPLDLWNHPPFEPSIQDGIITARGASDNKGQILAHILGVQTLLEKEKELPVNVVFLIEGEEEIGSTHLTDFIEQHQADLACDVAVISDSTMIAEGYPTFTYGLRGIAGLNINVIGPDQDLHSGFYGGCVMNPLTALSRLMASLHQEDGSIAVKDFYHEVLPLEKWEHESWGKLPYQDEMLQKTIGISSFFGEPGYTNLERTWARPTIEINGIYGGYQGPGSKTVLPSCAHAKLTCRLVPNQEPAMIQKRLQEHLQAHQPPGVRLTFEPIHGGYPYKVDPYTGYGKAAQRALKQTFLGREPALIREGGSIPIVAEFQRLLHVDTLLLGLALPDCHMHSPNETFPLAQLDYGIQLHQHLLYEISLASD